MLDEHRADVFLEEVQLVRREARVGVSSFVGGVQTCDGKQGKEQGRGLHGRSGEVDASTFQ
jgi:hypothetical protein